MIEWFEQLPEIEQAFVGSVTLGAILFVVRLLLGAFSSLFGDVGDFGEGNDLPGGGEEAAASFRILSFQGLSAFTTMFGLVGLALVRQQGTSGVVAVAGGFVAGALTVWIMGRLLIGIGKLESDGTIRLERAVGTIGTVDLTIIPEGFGKARIVIQQRLRVYDAVSRSTHPIRTGERVRVVDVMDGNVLVVEPYTPSLGGQEIPKEAKPG